MNARFIGGILLIVGTSIGGGMLALPVVNAATGFLPSTLLLFLCWLIMTFGAFYLLEVNLFFAPGNHLVSMARATLGMPGLVVMWLTYLLLLFTLLAAYISGGADVLGGLWGLVLPSAPDWLMTCLFTLVFGAITYRGIRSVDMVNRGLMFAKLGIYVLLVCFMMPHVRWSALQGTHWEQATGCIMVILTSFGFAIIVPNLRVYFEDDLRALKRVILFGSLIPLFCYIAWDAVIMGVIPSEGPHGLASLAQSAHPTSSLAQLLTHEVHQWRIIGLFNAFTSVCMLTAFLGVSLCLLSFLSDGLKCDLKGRQGLAMWALTFLPPLMITLFWPGLYLHALRYAGGCCVILLLLLPALMSYYGRKRYQGTFLVPGGRVAQALVVLGSVVLLWLM